jgi:hypothetical protein
MESVSLMSDHHAQHGGNNDRKHSAPIDERAELGIERAVDEDTAKEEKRFLRRLDWILMWVVF